MGNKIIFSLLFFIVIFIVTYLVYYFIFDDKLKKEKYTKITELGFLVRLNNLDKKKMNYRKCLNGVALIIAFTITFIDAVNLKIYLCLPIAFIMMFGMIYISYTLYGKHLAKKWGKDKDGI